MATSAFDTSLEIIRLIRPKTEFTATDIKQIGLAHNSHIFNSTGSSHRLDKVLNTRASRGLILHLVSGRHYGVDHKYIPHRYKYTLKKTGQQWIDEGYVKPVWGVHR